MAPQGLATGWTCGYADPGAATSAAISTTSVGSTPTAVLVKPAAAPAVLHTGREFRSLQFFVEKTIPQFTTFFSDRLWQTSILQVAETEPSIQHALYALSAFHEQFLRAGRTLRDTDGPEAQFALSQYNKAIQELTNSPSIRSPMLTNLVSSLLFFCIELLRGKYISAIQLFKYGGRILHEWRHEKHADQPPEVNAIARLVEATFIRLAVQISQLSGEVDPAQRFRLVNGCDVEPPEMPICPPFTSLCEAREAIAATVIDFMRQQSPGPAEFIRFTERIEIWTQAFNFFVSLNPSCASSPADRRTVALLTLFQRWCCMSLLPFSMPSYGSPMIWDDVLETFEEMVDLAAQALGLDMSLAAPFQSQIAEPQFHLDIGVTYVLSSSIMRCRDPIIRRKFVGLLKCATLQEGIWNSSLMVKVAEKLIELEEFGLDVVECASDIPAHARFEATSLLLDEEQRFAVMIYWRQGSRWEELISW